MPELHCIERIMPNPRNARTHTRKQIRQLANSISEFGFVVPILIDEKRKIIGGHGRYEAARLLGLKEVPVIVVKGLSEAKRRALAIADNKLAEGAGWDRERLVHELRELSALLVVEGVEISITGFDVPQIGRLVAEFEGLPQDVSASRTNTESRRNRARTAVCEYCGRELTDIHEKRRGSRRRRNI